MTVAEKEALINMQVLNQQDSFDKCKVCPCLPNIMSTFYQNYMQPAYNNPKVCSLAKSCAMFTFGIYLIKQIPKIINRL